MNAATNGVWLFFESMQCSSLGPSLERSFAVKDGVAIEPAGCKRFSGHALLFQLGKGNHRPNATSLETLRRLFERPRQHGLTIRSPFSLPDIDQRTIKVKIPEAKPRDFADSHSRCIHQAQQ